MLIDTEKISVAVAEPILTAKGDALFTVMLAGTEIAGGVLSVMTTVWFAVAEFPAVSVAVQVMVVAPSANGPKLLALTAGLGSASSIATASPTLTGVSRAVASAVILAGAVIVGGTVSGI